MSIQLSYTTKLEAISDRDDVKAILNAKLEATSPAQTVDYVGLAVDHIDAKVADINSAIKALQELKKHEEARREYIKEQVCEWLEDNGLDKLEGMLVSSITVYQPETVKELVITDEEALINGGYFKPVVDKTMAKNCILNGIEVEGARVEITHQANKIKINKKRAKAQEVE